MRRCRCHEPSYSWSRSPSTPDSRGIAIRVHAASHQSALPRDPHQRHPAGLRHQPVDVLRTLCEQRCPAGVQHGGRYFTSRRHAFGRIQSSPGRGASQTLLGKADPGTEYLPRGLVTSDPQCLGATNRSSPGATRRGATEDSPPSGCSCAGRRHALPDRRLVGRRIRLHLRRTGFSSTGRFQGNSCQHVGRCSPNQKPTSLKTRQTHQRGDLVSGGASCWRS